MLSDVRQSMNRVKKGVFLVRKGSYTTFRLNIVKIRKIWEKKGKIRKTWLMNNKRPSEIFALKMEIFSRRKNVVQKSWSANKFSVAPNSPPLSELHVWR